MAQYRLDPLSTLEANSISIFRETAAESENPALLFSGGKDSVVLAHLARKAFFPANIPFPFLQIDTGHNFPEVSEFIPGYVAELGGKLLVRNVTDYLAKQKLPDPFSNGKSRNKAQGPTLVDAIQELKFTACFGGGRRDEDKARAKERVASLRDCFGQWDPKVQRPEFRGILNFRINEGENLRVFPLSDWTELDVWEYIKRENLSLPSIYFAHDRECYVRGKKLLGASAYVVPREGEVSSIKRVRYRTVGDVIGTAAIESNAGNIEEIIEEVKLAKTSERDTRLDDDGPAAMEDRKKDGYF